MSKATIYFYLLIASILFPTTAFPQLKISGTITDSNNAPLDSAEVSLTETQTSVTQTQLSDKDGTFTFTTQAGTYTLNIKQLGSLLHTEKIEVTQDINLGILTVDSSKMLGEVVVENKKKLIEKKIDRLVFNVENSISASGGDALDALKLVPRVVVQNEELAITGKGSVSIMVDDRILNLSGTELTAYLKSIQADNIKSIEVITNPPAKYNAEGNSGMINIRLKKSKMDSWNGLLQGSYQQATYARGSWTAGFNYQKNKFSLQSSINQSDGSNAPEEDTKIYYPEYLWKELAEKRRFSKATNARIGLDYKLSNKLTTGIQYIRNANDMKVDEFTNAEIINNTTNTLDSIARTNAQDWTSTNYNSLNYHLVYSIDTVGTKISLDADYFNHKSPTRRFFYNNNLYSDGTVIPDSYSSALNTGNKDVHNYSVNIDVEQPLNFAKLNYGGRISYTKTQNEYAFYNADSGQPIPDPNQSNEFVFKENTQAAFIDASKEISTKWEAKIGIRLESTQTNGRSLTLNQQNNVHYTRLFPTAYLVYKPNENNSFTINYGKRIRRPSFYYLDPFRVISSPYSYTEGNPYLRPSYAHNVELEYGLKDLWTISLYYSGVKDGFEQVNNLDPETSIQRYIPLNFIKSKSIGISQSVNFEAFTWTKTYLSADVYYSEANSDIPLTLAFLKGWNGEFRINNDFILKKNKMALLNISYSYTTSGVDNLDTNSAFGQLNAALKMFFLQKKLQLILYGNDILRTDRTSYTGFSNSIKTSYNNYYDNRMLRISATYNFGGETKLKQRENKNSGEQDRLN